MIVLSRDIKGRFAKGSGLQDLTGTRFGRLTAVKLSEKRSGRKTFWDCICACGKEKTIRTDSLKDGSVRSCGCLKKEQDEINFKDSKFKPTHGETNTHIYQTWQSMKQRCNDRNTKSYKYYGGRGIKVSEEWENDYESFKRWAYQNGYKETLSIERMNVNGNYEPSNCTWIPMSEQARNKQNTIRIEYNGEAKTLIEWCEELVLDAGLVRNRHFKQGMQPPDLFKKGRVTTKTARLLTYQGKTQSITDWANEIGIKPKTLSERVRRGIEPPRLFYGESLNGYKEKTTPR